MLRAEVSAALARADSGRRMLQACAEALVRNLDAAFARIWTLNRAQQFLELQASAGLYTRVNGTYARVPVGHLKIGLIAAERAPFLTNEVANDPRIENKAWAEREGITAFAGCPLIVDERVVGVVGMFARRALDAATLDALESVASSIAQGIERKRSEDDLRRSEAYLAEGQRLSHTGSWSMKLESGERFWSREMFHIFGFEAADSPPPYDQVLGRAHPDDAEAVNAGLEEAFRTGTDLHLLNRICVPDEPVKWVETYGHPMTDDDGNVVEFIGTVIDVTERMRTQRRLRRAIKARYEAVLAERARIARDMHDGLLQDITGMALQLAALKPHVHSAPDMVTERLGELVALAEQTIREARDAVAGMRAGSHAVELVGAIHSTAQHALGHARLALSVNVTGRARPASRPLRDAAVGIVHEAVTNALKHANARTIVISIAFGRKRVLLTVQDDGEGFAANDQPTPLAHHFGIVGMSERAGSVGGAFTTETAPGQGARIMASLPLEHAGRVDSPT